MILRSSKRAMDNLRKKLETLFSKHGLKITAETGMKTTDYLDVTLDLSDGSYKPFRKDEQIPLYVNRRSNHPPAVTKNLPSMIERRVSNRCSTKQIFETHKRDYEQALKNSGYEEKIHYQDAQTTKRSRRPRYKQLFYFNPPWNQSVKTKLMKEYVAIIEKNFPPGSKWRKHLNKHTLKLSYSCTKNLGSIISSHNKKVLGGQVEKAGCNCRNPPCPLDGECLTQGLVYLGQFENNNQNYAYFGSTANTFKERYGNHKFDFNHKDQPGTALSRKLHELNIDDPVKQVKWTIANRCYPLTPGQPVCDVCTTEKCRIMLKHNGPPPQLPANCEILNMRQEIYAKCRHRAKFKLQNCDNLY